MKMHNFLLGTLLLIALSGSSIYAQDSVKAVKNIDDDSINLNYLEGVNSPNDGLRISSVFYLGERKTTKAVIPLMKILNNDKVPEARVMAALSLFKIGDKRGIYTIKHAKDFDDNEMVKKMCNIFYQMYLKSNEGEK
jgi:HEAT repeat protein